ncbi:MAG: endopeptidase La [Lachnospiraceae bacterium]|nr:endopeptidase La [Lachnospiraceae bacterium]
MDKEIKTLPVIALRGMTVLPGMLIHFDISRDITLAAVNEAMEGDRYVFVTSQKDADIEKPSYYDLFEVGVIAKIKQIVKLQDNLMRIMISSRQRATLISMPQTKPFLIGDVIPYEPDVEELRREADEMKEAEREAALRSIKEMYALYIVENPKAGKSIYDKIQRERDLGTLLDLVGMNLPIPMERRQDLLECFSVPKRFRELSKLLANEIEISKIREEYREKVKDEVDKNQRDYFLREQMKVIRDELGDNFNPGEEEEKYVQRLEQLECSEEIYQKIKEEIKRLKSLGNNSTEYAVARGYVETLLDLPWDRMSIDNTDLANAEKVLNEDHYGLNKVKERILEFLAVRTLTGKGESPIICLVGPPGTGKTSIAKSVARALNKEYVRICLGGVRDEAEIRGHRRTYVGAMPGRLIAGLKKAKVKNPLMLLDEIDKVSSDYKGDTSSALLEVLDPEQNRNFADHYVELPVDLSEVLFLCTANSLDTIARPLLDRMEVIELSGYSENEKYHIGKDYLIPKQLERNGLAKANLSIYGTALRKLIVSYTKEAGVRGLERQIGKICRKAAKQIVTGEEEKVKVTTKNLSEYVGREKYQVNLKNEKSEVGVVRGLAWTSVGGDTLEIEVNIMPGEGNLELTGQLGDVMKESAQIALTYVRSQVDDKEKQDFFKEHDIHIHVPEGAVPKDGPSAGVTMATALYSAVTGKKVRCDVAMTGEITLRGRVLPIGGLKEKLLAAKAAGIKTVFVPEKNRPDIEELDKEIVDGMELIFVHHAEQIFSQVLEGGK